MDGGNNTRQCDSDSQQTVRFAHDRFSPHVDTSSGLTSYGPRSAHKLKKKETTHDKRRVELEK